ncbi:unnamed protein product [Prunus armeniaca]
MYPIERLLGELKKIVRNRAKPEGLIIEAWVNKLKSLNSPTYSEELYNLAFGPTHVELLSGCHVNSVKFLGTA